ncbi:MAG TPA: hypothetical protein IAA60_03825 [Candidatus Ornithomonoglobus intestinigallinarum]|uniref:CBM6 domain-containing protein n=1 Tax=Candidatus Ornithomonoglobus intestinigallinarum TaxID=2840894 RepID=A0A9D1KPU0_9FIRM|nr:hypothetical protein [Candidatus Ornithomonoglobus intestinigallinarum]
MNKTFKKAMGIVLSAALFSSFAAVASAEGDAAAKYVDYYHLTDNYTSGYCARFEAEDFRTSYGNASWSEYSLVSANGGKSVYISKGTDGSVVFTMKVDVPVTGYYQFGAAISERTFVSPMAVSFNGGDYEAIRYTGSVTADGIGITAASAAYARKEYSSDNKTFGTNLYIRNDAIYLVEGENTITLKPGKRVESNPRIFASIDFIDLSFAGADYGSVIDTVEAEDLTGTGLNKTEVKTASGGYVAQYGDGDAKEKEVSFTINVPSAGTYTLKIGAALQANHTWLSPATLKVNDGENSIALDFTAFNNDNYMSYEIMEKNGANITFTPGLYTIENVSLGLGENTLTFNFTERYDEGVYEGVYFAIDFIDIVDDTVKADQSVEKESMTEMQSSEQFETEDGKTVQNVGFKLEGLSVKDIQSKEIRIEKENGATAYFSLSKAFGAIEVADGNITIGLQINNVPATETISASVVSR